MSDIDNCVKYKCKQCGVNTFYIKNEISLDRLMCTKCFWFVASTTTPNEMVNRIIRGEE